MRAAKVEMLVPHTHAQHLLPTDNFFSFPLNIQDIFGVLRRFRDRIFFHIYALPQCLIVGLGLG